MLKSTGIFALTLRDVARGTRGLLLYLGSVPGSASAPC